MDSQEVPECPTCGSRSLQTDEETETVYCSCGWRDRPKLPNGFPPDAADVLQEHAGIPLALYKGNYRKPAECWALHYMEHAAVLEASVVRIGRARELDLRHAAQLRADNIRIRERVFELEKLENLFEAVGGDLIDAVTRMRNDNTELRAGFSAYSEGPGPEDDRDAAKAAIKAAAKIVDTETREETNGQG